MDGMKLHRPREIIESEAFGKAKTELLDSLGESQRVLDDVLPSFDYVIAWNPRLYDEVVRGSGVRWFSTRHGVLPSLSIWYKADVESVIFLYIEQYSNGEDDDAGT